MSDNEEEPKRTEPCKECSRKSYRHFHIGDVYKFTLCTKCRNNTGYDHEINLTYMKKACVHFKRLWNVVLEKEHLANLAKARRKLQIPQLHSKDDFLFPVARYENYFDLDSIRTHIKNIWADGVEKFFHNEPNLVKYDPVSTFAECVEYALSKKMLKSKYIERIHRTRWDEANAWMHSRYYYPDFDFSTYKNEALFERKKIVYTHVDVNFAPIQALFRGHVVRKKANDRLRVKSAVAIQASWRKKRAMLSLKKHKQCAVKIQALCRGYYVRRPYGIYRSWALWNAWGAHNQSVPQELETIVHNLVRHGAVQRPKKRRKKADPKQKTLNQFWTGINISIRYI